MFWLFLLQDMWNHKELNQADCSSNGEVTSIVYFKNYIFSGHSDGTLKVGLSKSKEYMINKEISVSEVGEKKNSGLGGK